MFPSAIPHPPLPLTQITGMNATANSGSKVINVSDKETHKLIWVGKLSERVCGLQQG